MRKRLLAAVLSITTIAACAKTPPLSAPSTAEAQWQLVLASRPDAEVHIVLRGGSEIWGTLVSATEHSLTLKDNRTGPTGVAVRLDRPLREPTTFQRTQIARAEVTVPAPKPFHLSWEQAVKWTVLGIVGAFAAVFAVHMCDLC